MTGAHLDFLRARGVSAWLVLVNFIGDGEVAGPTSAETWRAAYDVAFHAMGLRRTHPLARHVLHVAVPIASPAEPESAPG